MNTRISSQNGSVLLPCLIISAIIGLAMASYLRLVSAQNHSVARSQLWNAAIPVCESGIEEALAHINDSAIGTNYALNGWTVSGDSFVMERAVGPDRYRVTISTNGYPTITSAGYVKDEVNQTEVSRTVEVTTTKWSTGMKGIVAKYNLSMTSSTVVDSFDSEDERYSTSGRYDATKHKDNGFAGSVHGNVEGATIYGSVGTGPDGAATGNVGDFAWIAGNTGIEPGHYANDLNLAFPIVQAPFSGGAFAPGPDTVTLTNFNYWSTMVTTTNLPSTPPASPITTNSFGNTTVTTYPTGVNPALITTNTTSTRSKTMPASGTCLNLELKGAWYYYDLITSYTFPVQTYTYSMTATNASATTELYNYVLRNDRYQMNELSMSGNQRLLVLGTNVTLYIKQDFKMTGNSSVIIAPGASLKLFVGGETSLAGNGIFNYTLDASHFMYYGLPGNTKIDIQGNASFTGVIYAPQAEMSLGGGGSNIYDVVGATVTKTAVLNGHFNFHYDERLGRSKILSKFTVASWREI